MANFTGTGGNDIFTGGAEDDFAHGGAGNDTLSGAGGNDHLAGETGIDTLNGGDGDDALASGPVQADWDSGFYVYYAEESLDTATGRDTLSGGAGEDHLWAGYGDNVDGGEGIDFLSISFLGAPSGVTADFSLTSLSIGGGTIQNIESLIWVQGSNYADTITAYDNAGGYGAFTKVYGMGGNDHLIAGYTTATLDGGAGDDVVDGRNSQYLDAVIGGSGNDTLYTNSNTFASADGGDGNDTIYAHGETSGGAGDDTIIMSYSYYPGLVSGDEGNDTITAGGSGNVIAGGSGADHLNGGDAADALGSGDFSGSEPADDLGLEHDVLNGGGGDDRLSAGYGDDVDGGDGSDTLHLSLAGLASGLNFTTAGIASGGPVSIGGGTIQNVETLEYLRGTDFADKLTIATQDSLLTIDAGAGNDVVTSQSSSVALNGGEGNDRLISGPAGDLFNGGAGTDWVDYQKAATAVTVTLADNGAAGAGAGGDQLIDVENVFGSKYADSLTGNGEANVLRGGDGNDNLNGGDGDDTLQGDAGSDRMAGGLGDDTFVVTDNTDRAIENAGEGVDLVKASVTFALGSNVEDLTLTGSAAINGTGNGLSNTITGNDASNNLAGAAGADRLIGGGGVDHLDGGDGGDVYLLKAASEHSAAEIVDSGGNGFDEVRFAATTASTLTLFAGDSGMERVVIGTGVAGAADTHGTTALNINASAVDNGLTMIGNAGKNILTATAFADVLNGGAGADKLVGGAGDDTYLIDSSGDAITETANAGTDTVRSSISYVLVDNAENLALVGGIAVRGTGNALDNVIIGNDADNLIDGREGADHLTGGRGADRFIYRDGQFGGSNSDTADEILDFHHGQHDRINLAAVDANSDQIGDQAFAFIGTAAFSHSAGELRYEIVGGDTLVTGDTNGDGVADFMIKLDGSHALVGADFVF